MPETGVGIGLLHEMSWQQLLEVGENASFKGLHEVLRRERECWSRRYPGYRHPRRVKTTLCHIVSAAAQKLCGIGLKPGGVLAFVVPSDRVYDCHATLTTQFRDKAVYRLTAPESITYKQVVLFGVRRSRPERERMTDRAVNEGNWKLQQLTRSYDAIPQLPDEPDRQYTVPPAPPARLEYRGLPLDLIEDLLDNSPVWRQAQRITHTPKTEFSGRPLTPLHKGHVGLLCTSGLLNGVFGSAGDRHVAYWESVKVVDRIEEEGERPDTTVVREKERFSQRLTLLYADGRIELLSERAAPNKNGDTRDEERTSANGQADLCAPDAGHGDERLDSPASGCC